MTIRHVENLEIEFCKKYKEVKILNEKKPDVPSTMKVDLTTVDNITEEEKAEDKRNNKKRILAEIKDILN